MHSGGAVHLLSKSRGKIFSQVCHERDWHVREIMRTHGAYKDTKAIIETLQTNNLGKKQPHFEGSKKVATTTTWDLERAKR
eukprot:4903818-Amphidinium_carterae.1